jgi:glucose-6-phosphate isomerase
MIFSQSLRNISPAKITPQAKKIAKDLQNKIINKKLPQIDVIFNQKDLAEFTKLSKEISSYKKILILGVGGSSLGGKTLTALKFQNKLEFLESIDPTTVKNSFDSSDLKNTFFLVISKSGETIETICQTLIIIEILKQEKVKNFAQQFLFVTESKNNSIAKIATEIGSKIAYHPQDIGGRFSCFSIVGMLPAILAGLDAKKIRLGAKKIVEDFLKDETKILKTCLMQLELYNKGYSSNVIMPYVDNLKNFTDWYRQLWAESLGKEGFGSVPINSMGTVDQHSQLQLYLEGPKDKFFTFVVAKKFADDFLVKDLKTKTLFGGKKLSAVVKVEQDTTIEVLNKKRLPIRIFEIEKLNEEVLGGLMMQMFLEVILIANLKKIDPFNQPAVELRKDLAKKILKK